METDSAAPEEEGAKYGEEQKCDAEDEVNGLEREEDADDDDAECWEEKGANKGRLEPERLGFGKAKITPRPSARATSTEAAIVFFIYLTSFSG